MSVEAKVRELEEQFAKLDKLQEKFTEDRDPGFTAQEFADRYKVSNGAAQGRLRRWVSAGKLIMGWTRNKETGVRQRVYRFPEE